ncbi:hypothetical protein NKR23_g10314 [Pleurostoma richardsiae]|uniref:Isochorismatase-like domain-containing protein n=1 Tax=Pleurostoma richardsiae TaxID=41990 RepID=A0AA38VIQ9_9PEZI|nr:hypothetical protein NKR23_g10314 [Pleurostoma richardsiae]
MTLALDPSSYPAYAAECGDPSRTKKLGFGARPAVLVVDVCEAYFNPSSPLRLPDETLHSVSQALALLLAAAREAPAPAGSDAPPRLPVFFAQTFYTHAHLRDAGLLALKAPSHSALFHGPNPDNMADPPRGPERDAIRPAAHDIALRKKYPSPFFGTNFATQLAAMGVDTLLVCGFATSGSVRAAALDAMQAGFRAMVVAEACGDRGAETHWANLMDVGAKYGDVVSVEAAVDAIRNGWRA